MNSVVRSDIEVSHFLDSVGAVNGYNTERRDHLLDILDVDLSWRMHQVISRLISPMLIISLSYLVQISDGERRRVQLCMGLMATWDVLLLDEVFFSIFQPPTRADYLIGDCGSRRPCP